MLRVLVVDDWPDTIMGLQWLLQSWGHEVCLAADGPIALKMTESLKPDVVILDLGLPEMDGYEVAKRLRRPDSHKPIIIAHTGYCSEDDIRRALEAGCNYHLKKPVDPEELQRLLECCKELLEEKPSA
jgi:CheY-like chemotaxis protein